jgi:hypothetical protein
MHIKPMNPQERVTKPGLFAWFFAPFKKSAVEDSDSADDADNNHKGPFDPEELADLKDSLAPIYDQLELNRFWWIAEYIPFKRYQEVEKKLQLRPEVSQMNKGLGRKIPKYKGNEEDFVRLHRSVKTRMEARCRNGDKYTPKLEFLRRRGLSGLIEASFEVCRVF